MQARHGSESSLNQIFDIAFSPDGREFASVGVDGQLLRWKLPRGPGPAALASSIDVEHHHGLGERLYSVAYHPTRQGVVATGGKRTIELVNLEQRGTLLARPLATGVTAARKWTTVAMNPAGSTVAASRGDGVIALWRREDERMVPIAEWTVKVSRNSRFTLDASGSTLVTVACGAEVLSWRLMSGETPAPATIAKREASNQSCPETNPALSRDGNLLAVAIGSRLKLWTRGNDGSWELRFDREFDDSEEGEPGSAAIRREITGLTMTAAPDLVIAGNKSGRIRLLEVRGGSPAAGFRTATAEAGSSVTSLVTLPDSSGVLAGGKDGLITKWSLPALKKEAYSELHQRGISGLALADRSQPGNEVRPNLISTDWGGAIVEWSQGKSSLLDGAKSQIERASDRPIEAMALRADGAFLVTAGDQLLEWNFDRAVMKASAERFLRNHDR